jgi:hypothetical protein
VLCAKLLDRLTKSTEREVASSDCGDGVAPIGFPSNGAASDLGEVSEIAEVWQVRAGQFVSKASSFSAYFFT